MGDVTHIYNANYVGAGLGGRAFAAATQASGMAIWGNFALGVGASFAGGFAGNLAGTISNNFIDPNLSVSDINWKDTIGGSIVMGGLNVPAGFGSAASSGLANMGHSAIHLQDKTIFYLLAGLTAGGTEGVFDLVSYFINKLIS